MSTKIYTGIQIQHMNMIELNKYMANVRKQLIPIAHKEYYKAFAKLVEELVVYIQTGVQLADNVDDYTFKARTPNEIIEHANKLASQIIKNNKSARTIMEHRSDFDFDMNIYIFPIKRKLLGMYFIENEVLKDAFLNLPEISDYAYWNNTDRPDNISSDSWNRRRSNWDEALTGLGIPSECGFKFELLQSDIHAYRYFMYPEDVVPYLSDQEALRNRVARNKVYSDEFKRIQEKNPEMDTMRIYSEAMAYMKNHPEIVKQEAEQLKLDIVGFLTQN